MPAVLADGSLALPRPRLLPSSISTHLYADAVRAFLNGHKPQFLREILNVTVNTLGLILESDEWAWACDAYRVEMQRSELALMTRNVNKALAQCITRLEEGDPVLVKLKGGATEVVYAPVKAKDAAAIAAVLMDRRDRLERKLGGETTADPLEDLERLASIASKLRQLAPARNSNVIEMTPRLDVIDLELDRDGE